MPSKNYSEDFETIKWVFSVADRSLAKTLVLLFIEMLTGASVGIQALLFRNVIDAAVARNFDSIVQNVIALVALIVAVMLLGAIGRYLKEKLTSTIENQFKHRIMDTVLSGDYTAVRSLHTGDWLTRLTSDTTAVASLASTFFPKVGGTIVRLIVAAFVLFSFDAVLGALVLTAGAVTIFPSAAMRKKFKAMQKTIQAANKESRVHMQEQLGNLLVVHSYAREKEALEETDHLLEEYRDARLKRTNVSNAFMLIRGFLTRGMYGITALWCVYGIYAGTMSYGTLVAILQLVSQVQGPLSEMAGFVPNLYAALASAERLREIETLVPEHSVFKQEKPSSVEGFSALGLNDVKFSYEEPDHETIHGITLHVPKGSYTAFVGPSGCGKSTVLKLFMCLYPIQDGTRYFDDAQGHHDLERYARWLFAYVPQGNMLMTGTIREIVALHDKNSMQEDERLWEALRVACADEFVSSLSKGLDTQLGERGEGLSEGQTQRIAIARAVFSGRPVLLLDESTSALDKETEARLLANLRSMTDKTVLIVAHRPAALEIVDTIVHFSEDCIDVERKDAVRQQDSINAT